MRHRVTGRRLGRTSEHRLAMRRSIVASLFEHETISTTITKAKEVKSFAEKLITLSRKGTLSARRRAITLLGTCSNIVIKEEGEEGKGRTVLGKLFSELGPRYLDRPGGYTRIIHLALRRLGDNTQLVLLQLVGADEDSKKHHKKTAAAKKNANKKAKNEEEAVVAEAEVVEVQEVSQADAQQDEGDQQD